MTSQQPTLGAILVGDRVVSEAQLADALNNQVVYGGRLGTNLIELGYATHDQIALALAKRWQLPAALTKHLANHDKSLIERLPRDLARRCLAFPIARLKASSQQVAVCFRDPIDEAVNAVSRAMGAKIVASVAAEAAVLYWLERCYGLARPQRYALSAPGGDAPLPRTTGQVSVPEARNDDFDIDVVEEFEASTLTNEYQLVDLDHQDVVKDFTLYQPQQRSMNALLEVTSKASELDLAEAAKKAAELASEAAVGAVEVSHAADAAKGVKQAVARPKALSLSKARAAIADAQNREAVSSAVLGFMASHFDGALMIIIKGDLALGYRGFGGNFDDDSVESIVIPLSVPTMFKRVIDDNAVFVGEPPKEAHAVQRRFLKLFPSRPKRCVIAPVLVRKRLVCMLYGHPPGDLVMPEVTSELAEVAKATQEAFLRLIRQAKSEARV